MNLSWLEHLTKPFSSLFDPIAERIGNWVARRKPKLYVHFNLGQTVWSIARQAEGDGSFTEMMQIVSWADVNHDDPKETLVITDAHPPGTYSRLPAPGKFAVPPRTLVHQQISAFVLPVKGEKGTPWRGKLILVDQFFRKYKTRSVVFQWVGPVPPASPTT
jgi:hypothetical protein